MQYFFCRKIYIILQVFVSNGLELAALNHKVIHTIK